MTRRQFLEAVDSVELTQWLLFFEEKARREQDARESAELEARVNQRGRTR
jgi:hypothetical protein